MTDEELELQTGEPHIDGWPLYSGLPPPVCRKCGGEMPDALDCAAAIREQIK